MKINIEGTISHIEKRLDAHDSAFDSLAERNVEAEIENILDRLAVRMYDEGQLDKPSLMGRQVAIVNINEAKAQLNQLLIKAELKGFLTAYDCHDYPRLREYKANLENQIKVRNRQRAEQRANLREDK